MHFVVGASPRESTKNAQAIIMCREGKLQKFIPILNYAGIYRGKDTTVTAM